MNKKALVTLAIGDAYLNNYNEFCLASWNAYADRHGYDIIVYSDMLDTSERAMTRSPAWQKCLILEQPEVQQYDQVVWIDSDIIITSDAPCICSQISDVSHIAAVDSYGMPNQKIYSDMLNKHYKERSNAGINMVKNATPRDCHAMWGYSDDELLPAHENAMVQTGVIVMSPLHHRETLKYVYDNYEDKGDPEWNFEMRPLSYELLKRHDCEWLDWRFNAVVSDMQQQKYPFLGGGFPQALQHYSPEVVQSLGDENMRKIDIVLNKVCLDAMYRSSFFLHFAGCQQMMILMK